MAVGHERKVQGKSRIRSLIGTIDTLKKPPNTELVYQWQRWDISDGEKINRCGDVNSKVIRNKKISMDYHLT